MKFYSKVESSALNPIIKFEKNNSERKEMKRPVVSFDLSGGGKVDGGSGSLRYKVDLVALDIGVWLSAGRETTTVSWSPAQGGSPDPLPSASCAAASSFLGVFFISPCCCLAYSFRLSGGDKKKKRRRRISAAFYAAPTDGWSLHSGPLVSSKEHTHDNNNTHGPTRSTSSANQLAAFSSCVSHFRKLQPAVKVHGSCLFN